MCRQKTFKALLSGRAFLILIITGNNIHLYSYSYKKNLSYTEDEMDKLQERAESFRKLLDNEYIIKLGRKNQITELTIDFERSDFLSVY